MNDEKYIIDSFTQSINLGQGVIGIGDDCAVIPISEGQSMVVTLDTMTEDTHFIFDSITPEQLSYKAIASNISDVVAMGAKPTSLFLALTFSDKCTKEWIDRFSSSFKEVCRSFNVSLLGGDTTYSSHAITISITAMGVVNPNHLKLRSMAHFGDTIAICAPLGVSNCGLQLLLEGSDHPLVSRHFTPPLYIEQAQWLGRQNEVGAMMDISDGIAKDLHHILKMSNVGGDVNLDSIPIDSMVQELCSNRGWDAVKLSVEGGEEFAPLFTVREGCFEALASRYFDKFGMELYSIGSITEGGFRWIKDGVTCLREFSGYSHSKI